jgi:acyl-CoA synthetase (AMP-forming)/AMP-acid ligase II
MVRLLMDFNFADLHETIARTVPEREGIVFRDRRFSYAAVAERTRRLANYLIGRGLQVRAERSALATHESGQAHLALYLYNGNEFLEGMLGAFKARVAPLNVNYRYVDEELLYLFENADAEAVLYHAEFAPTLARIRDRLPNLRVLLQVADDSGNALLPGAVDYEEALASASPGAPPVTPSPDDLYIVYTGGTTGMPKGVLWRSGDAFVAAMGGRKWDGTEFTSYEDVAEYCQAAGDTLRTVVGPPLMHAAAQWACFIMMTMGATIVFPGDPKRFAPDDFLATVERERATTITIVGDAFAVPLIDALERKTYDLSSLVIIGSGGAPLSTTHKRRLLELIPHVTVLDAIGSSETGAQATNPATKDSEVTTGDFKPGPGTGVVSEDFTRVLAPGSEEMGWFAQEGRVPLGYYRDAAKTARTFPTIGGVRYSVPGDRARYRADGTIEVLGRDSVTINSGGEKIFAEEVEAAIKHHPAVWDVVVAGRPSERWGQEVVAIVQLRAGTTVTADALIDAAGQHVARYKLPKAIVFRDTIVRSPSGKADYRWAKEQAASAG